MASAAQPSEATLAASSLQEVISIYSGTQTIGQAFDPISENIGFAYVTYPDGQPVPLQAPVTLNHTKAQLQFVNSSSAYESLSGENASANVAFKGLVFSSSGSIEANFSTQSAINESSIAMVAMATNVASSAQINCTDSQIDVTEAVNEITANGYDSFCEANGTHFVAGYFYGNFYMASYTSYFDSDTNAQNAAVNVAAEASVATDSGSITAGYTSAVSAQMGYQSSNSQYQSLGSVDGSGSTSPDGINAALAAFPPAVTTSPIYLIAVDWRAIPAIHNIPGLSTAVNYANYYANMPAVQQTLAGLQLGLQTANNTVPIGPANQTTLAGYVTSLKQQITAIQALTPGQVASFDASPYNNYLTELNNFPGDATITVTFNLDSSFTPGNPAPLTYSGPVMPTESALGATFLTVDHTPLGGGSEQWAFGCYYTASGVVKLAMGLRTNGDTDWDSSGLWTNVATSPFQYSPNGSNSFTIYGVGPNANTANATYPWIKITVTIAPYTP